MKQSGRFKEQFTDEQFIEAVSKLSLASCGDVAKEIGCSSSLAKKRLNTLYENRDVDRTFTGAGWVYYL